MGTGAETSICLSSTLICTRQLMAAAAHDGNWPAHLLLDLKGNRQKPF